MFCYFLFSKRHFVLHASSSDDLTCRGVTSLTHILIYMLAFVSASQRTPRTANMCDNILSCFAPLDDRGDRTNQLHWLKLLHRVFYSVDKCFVDRSRSMQHFP